MSKPFIFINTYRILPGKEEEYRRAHHRVAEIVEAEEPRMLYFGLHVSEDGTEGTTVQVHADAENMAFHMQLLGDHIRGAAEFLDWDSMAIRIYGTPSEEVLEQMREVAGSGLSVTISPPVLGFDRFDAS